MCGSTQHRFLSFFLFTQHHRFKKKTFTVCRTTKSVCVSFVICLSLLEFVCVCCFLLLRFCFGFFVFVFVFVGESSFIVLLYLNLFPYVHIFCVRVRTLLPNEKEEESSSPSSHFSLSQLYLISIYFVFFITNLDTILSTHASLSMKCNICFCGSPISSSTFFLLFSL